MKIWRLLFDPRGMISRMTFAFATAVLVAVKIAGDLALARLLFHHDWGFDKYLFPHLAMLFDNSQQAWKFYTAFLLWTTPFAWMGLCLLAKRLRAAGAPMALIVLFFVPIAKFFLFAVLCVLPERQRIEIKESVPPPIRKWAPESSLASASLAIVCATALGIGLIVPATKAESAYLIWLFLGLPFLMGFLAAWIHGLARPRRLNQSLLTAYLSLIIAGVILLCVAFEGLLCLVMVAPIAFCEATAGAWIAHLLHQSAWKNRSGMSSTLAACFTLTLLLLIDTQSNTGSTEIAVATEVSINASPAVVWQHVVSFDELPPPHEWIFRLGIAYPMRAKIDGHSVGALRHCIFSTGTFIEPITAWDEPARLAFDVIAQPDPLTELSPYRNLRPPHLHGYFQSHRGEFLLRQTSDGTLLRGTTWYSNRIEPQLYWKFWSDALIHRIHLRVLNHIKREAEQETAANLGPNSTLKVER